MGFTKCEDLLQVSFLFFSEQLGEYHKFKKRKWGCLKNGMLILTINHLQKLPLNNTRKNTLDNMPFNYTKTKCTSTLCVETLSVNSYYTFNY
jgi:hypothetical protein